MVDYECLKIAKRSFELYGAETSERIPDFKDAFIEAVYLAVKENLRTISQNNTQQGQMEKCPLWVYPAPTCNLGYDCICKSVPCKLIRAQHQ